MQVSKEELHSQVSSIHELYRNYARIKVDHNLLQRKYRSCLLSLKTSRSENQTLKDNFKNIYVTKDVHDIVVKDHEELQKKYASLKTDYNYSVNNVQISYQSTCQALNDLQKDYKSVVLKCEELTSQNRLLENMTVNVNEQLKEENQDLTKELEKCRRDNAKALKENERLRVSVQDKVELQKKYEKLLSSSHEFTRECDRLRHKVQSLDVVVQEMTQSKLDHEKKLSRVTEENVFLLSKLAHSDGKYSEVVKQRNAFEVEVRALEKQLERTKCDTSFDFQKKYDKSHRNYTNILMDIRQLLDKYEEVKVDTRACRLATEEKFCYDFVQKDECDSISCNDVNASTHLNPIKNNLLTQENRDCQVINNKFKIKELISDSPTLEQDTLEDDEMLKFIFESTIVNVMLLSPIPSPTLEEPALLSIPDDVGDSNDIHDLVEKDMLIGEHQSSWISDEDLLVSSTTSDIKFTSANISDKRVTAPVKEQHITTVNVEASLTKAEAVQTASVSEKLRTLDSSFSTEDEETNTIRDNVDNKAFNDDKATPCDNPNVDKSLSRTTNESVSCTKTTNLSSTNVPNCKEVDNVVTTANESIQTPDLVSIKNQSDKKSKTLTDFDNVDSAFGSLCSSDEELVTAEQPDKQTDNSFLELSKLNDASNQHTLGFKDDQAIVTNSINKLEKIFINKLDCRACLGFNLRKRKEHIETIEQSSDSTKKRRINLDSFLDGEEFSDESDTCVEPHQTSKSTRKIRDPKFVKANRLIKHMLQFSKNNNIIFEVARNFIKESPEFLVKLILKRASTDILDAPIMGQYPMEPRLTLVQKGLYKFTTALETLGVEGVCKLFFKQADVYIRTVDTPVLMEPVVRLYVAFCKGKSDYWQMRMALCGALADLGDLAVPYMYIVLQAWIEVLPRKDMVSHGHVLTKTIVQLVLLKNVKSPGYNLMNLRSLLFSYYGFSSDRFDSNELFKELVQCYLDEQNECARVLAIALSNHLNIKFLVEEIFPNLSKVSPNKSVRSINSAITLVMHLTKHLYEKMDGADLQKNLEWLREFSSELYPYPVREHANQLLSWFLQCDSVPYNILEAV